MLNGVWQNSCDVGYSIIQKTTAATGHTIVVDSGSVPEGKVNESVTEEKISHTIQWLYTLKIIKYSQKEE